MSLSGWCAKHSQYAHDCTDCLAALPPSSPVADSPTDLEEADARILHLEAAIQGVLDAYGDDGWARSEMCRRLRRALETSAPSPSAGAAKDKD